MENPQHVPLGLVNSHMDVPKGTRLQDRCPNCGEKSWKYLYNNNNTRYQVRVQCLRTDCKHKYELFAFRKAARNHGSICIPTTTEDIYQVRVQCLHTDCKHKYQLFAFRKLHPNRGKKVKVTELEQCHDRVKVCLGCRRSNVKLIYGLNNNDAIQT